MGSDKETVEVYDNATGQHYTREATEEELMVYQQMTEIVSSPSVEIGLPDA